VVKLGLFSIAVNKQERAAASGIINSPNMGAVVKLAFILIKFNISELQQMELLTK